MLIENKNSANKDNSSDVLHVFQMTARTIRMQCLSLNAAGGKPYENILLYIKKLTAIRSVDGERRMKGEIFRAD